MNDEIKYDIFHIRVEQGEVHVSGVFKLPARCDDNAFRLTCDAERRTPVSTPGGVLSTTKDARPPAMKGRFWDFTIPLDGPAPFPVTFRIVRQDGSSAPCPVDYQQSAPLAKTTRSAYFRECGWLVRSRPPQGFDVWKASFFRHVKYELRYDAWLLFSQSSRRAMAAIPIRWLTYILRPLFLKRRIWLLMDRMGSAGDNAEALFKFLMKHKADIACRPVFILKKSSPHWSRLKSIGPVLPYSPFRFRATSLFAEWTVASQAIPGVEFKPLSKNPDGYRGLANDGRFAFLQHGVTKDDMSSRFNRSVMNPDILVTVAKAEREAFVSTPGYGYQPNNVVLTGFPRFDYFERQCSKVITFLPTWRRPLCSKYDAQTDTAFLSEDFTRTRYFRHLQEAVTSPRLLTAAETLGFTIQFLPHPQFQLHERMFAFSDKVKLLPSGTSYADVYAKSAICVTDFSSAVFDFAWLEKPVVYYQPDDDRHYQSGYFDYDHDGFGPVTHSAAELVDRLIDLMRRGCPMDEPYRTRAMAFFAFHDRNNCRRVTDAILAASTSERRHRKP